MMKRSVFIILVMLAAFSCTKYDGVLDNPFKVIGEATEPDTTNYSAKEGLEYVFDGSVVPEIHVTVSLSEWNRLLSEFDRNSDTDEYVKCDVRYRKGSETVKIENAGIRLRGNTSRRRPEGQRGRMHQTNDTDWHHCHFQLNFHKYVKDSAHELHGARKIILKWFNSDPAYVREIYCYDLFHRFGVWTAPHSTYCRLFLKVGGDVKETYYGVYEMVEPVDERSVKIRKEQFGDKDGFLWKCQWGARLNSTDAEMEPDLGQNVKRVYELKTQVEDFPAAKAQLQDLIRNLTELGDGEFHSWIADHCDVELLLRTIAVNVTVGMWDDYWNNCSNYFLYFNSHDPKNYKFWMIPFDYDNTLGTSQKIWGLVDSGRQNPYQWGGKDQPLISRIISFQDYRQIYTDALKELIDPDNGEFYYERSIPRIKAWQRQISSFVANDTGEDMEVKDLPSPWSNHQEYRLLDRENNNFFRVKEEFYNLLFEYYE